MIENERQYEITCDWARRFQEAVDKFDDHPREGISPGIRRAIRAGMEAKLSDLLEEIEEYKRLKADPTAKPKEQPPINFDGAEAHCELGKHRRDKGDMESAFSHFNEAIRIRPHLAEAWYHRGVAKLMRSDLDGAIADYNEVIRLQPEYAEAWNNRGLAKLGKGDIVGAVADIDEAIRLQPNDVDFIRNREIALALKAEKDEEKSRS